MTFSAELSAEAFAGACRRASSIAPSNPKIPITGNALLQADAAGISISATNLDQSITVALDGSGQGAITASAARLSTIGARLDPDSPVKLSATQTQLTITQGRAVYKVPVLPADDFPESLTAPLERADSWQVPAEHLVHRLKCLEGTIRANESRFYLVGAFFDFKRSAMVATDGAGMGVISMDDLSPPDREGVILPFESFHHIADLAKEAEAMDLAMTDAAITIEAAGHRLRTKLVAGTYPDWPRVVPPADSRRMRITVEAADLARVLARVGIVENQTKDKKDLSSIVLDLGESEIVASSSNDGGEEAIDACPCRRIEGEDRKIRVATKLLNWMATSLADADTLEIGLGESAADPITVHRAADTERRDLRVLMPMRV